MNELRPTVQNSFQTERERIRKRRARGELPNFQRGNYVLVAREEFAQGQKLCLRWRGPRRIKKALNYYVLQVENLRNGKLHDVHGVRLKFYRDGSLDKKTILFHVLSSETGMPVSRLRHVE